MNEVRSGGSYLSQSDLRLHFGLGKRLTSTTLRLRGQAAHGKCYGIKA